MTATRTRITIEPDHYEPYAISQAIVAGGTVYVSGQSAIGPDGATVGGDDFEAQARQAFANLDKVLTAAGSSLSDVVKVNIMVTDMSHLDIIVKLRREYFTAPYPADNLFQVAGLAQPDWLVEIDAIALVKG
ncbi:RidA family protein [Phytomonospora sp. NPDC050363]|uniref:RidA family protein n=1 Tax=Phytomonospora sp. NPDC050363 TaxID=3155642 RepID=UPI0033D5F9F4